MPLCSRPYSMQLNARQEADKSTVTPSVLNSRHRWQDGIPDVEVPRRADSVTMEAPIASYLLYLTFTGEDT